MRKYILIAIYVIIALFNVQSFASVGEKCNAVFGSSLFNLSIESQNETDQDFKNYHTVEPTVLKNKFVTSRTLSEYQQGFVTGFLDTLFEKPKNQNEFVWMDLGAGKGIAAENYLKEYKKRNFKLPDGLKVFLVAYKIDRWFSVPSYEGHLHVLEGKLFEDYKTNQLPMVDVLTDFFGVVSYTKNLSRSLNLALHRLKRGGEFYIHSSNQSIRITTLKGESLTLHEYLLSVEGIKVEGRFGILKITKLVDQVVFPQLQFAKSIEGSLPPFHLFQMVEE